jgi:hypothetical protein
MVIINNEEPALYFIYIIDLDLNDNNIISNYNKQE